MKHVGQVALATAVVVGLISFSVTVAAQGQKKAKAGASASSHNMTGCLQKGDTANTFKLTNVEGSGPKTVEIDGMATGVNLSPHVGHKVTITGTDVLRMYSPFIQSSLLGSKLAGLLPQRSSVNFSIISALVNSC